LTETSDRPQPLAADESADVREPFAHWVCLLLGAGGGVAGLLPWIVAGMRLPLQNLWADASTLDMPPALLPFSQYAITGIIGLIVVGSAAAGLAARVASARLPRRGRLSIFGGLLVVQFVAIVQTSLAVRAGLRSGTESIVYLALLIAVAVLAVAVGVGAFWLVAAAPRAGALIGLGIGALALGPWLSTLVVPPGSLRPDWLTLGLLPLLRWVPPILVGAAIAWSGVRTVGRVLASLAVLVLLWIVPALQTAISASAGTRVLARRPAEMLDYGVAVFRSALTMPELALPPIIVAIVVALLGLGVRAIVAARRTVTSRTA
jgi:hypothetical protein